MPDFLLDPNWQGLIALILVCIGGIFALIKWVLPRSSESVVTKLEVKYPEEGIQSRLNRIEGMLIQVLHEIRRSDEGYDETGVVAHFLLDMAKDPSAVPHPDGMSIPITPVQISEATYIKLEIVQDILKDLEEQGLIYASTQDIVAYGTR